MRPRPDLPARRARPAAIAAACLLAIPLFAGPSAAQERVDREVSVGYAVELHDGDERDPWHTATVALQGSGERVTLRFEGRATRRFDADDADVRVTGWTDLWEGAWTRLSAAGAAEGTVLPRADLAADLYQAIDAWEIGGGLRWLDVGEDVTVARLAAARYVADLYLRADGFRTEGGDESGTAVSGRVRGFLEGSDEYWELSAAHGNTLELTGGDTFVVLSSTRVAAGVVKAVASDWRIGLSGSLTDLEDVPTRYGLRVTIRRGW